jgi:hypothetical protein
MASKHAALYFEAYKQHHLVCSSLHTLSCARCLESKVVVLMGESPRQASPSHGTVEDEAAETRSLRSNPPEQHYGCCVLSERTRLALQISASTFYAKYDWYPTLSIAVKRRTEWHSWMPDAATLWTSCTHAND